MKVAETSITVSARVGFESVEQIPDRFADVDFPIELALPWQYRMWEEALPKWDEMVAALEEADLDVASVHATQGRISDPSFLTWGRETCELAERLGARTVTVHPNRAKKTKLSSQALAQQHIRALQRETEVVISVETFGGRDRVFTPDEIMGHNLPMTLDTAHLHDDERILRIVRDYRRHIPVVHLSARASGEHHLPVDAFCIRLVRELASLGWPGVIVLEYLPWHHYRLPSDRELVEQALVRDITPSEISSPCDAYKNAPEMWHHDAPDPR